MSQKDELNEEAIRNCKSDVMTDENTYVSNRWGVTTFHEAPKGWGEKKTCAHCILREDKEDCDRARCTPEFRADGKDGYFTVQNFPTPPEK